MAVRVTNGEPIPDIDILRFRTPNIQNKKELKLGPQFEATKDLLVTDELPEFLREVERDVTFRMRVRPDELLLQSRYASTPELYRFLDGTESARALEGKLDAYQSIMRNFVRAMKQSKFEPLEGEKEPV